MPTRQSPPLRLAGFVPFSPVDRPGRLVATAFTQGCPWRCTYCHNPSLQEVRRPPGATWQEVLDHLGRRRGLLDGLVVSGGEPTLQPGLPDACRDVHDLGLEVGLHTGGAWPDRLARVLPHVDWVALDIKAPPRRYARVTGAGPSGAAAWRSLGLVLASGVDHEVRTTVDPTVHSREDVLAIGAWLTGAGVERWVLQEARPDGADPLWARRLRGRRLADVLRDDDLPGVERRVA
ncbi:pyruvate formate lyase activating enzyme [Isoptericola jiangsuensis]|uniref:Pyruvate formate lyase activating enzyme n=1 Tax=Isoptericola jiangsuensis TaxID=548579 RepID=A0A2A9EW40_9MICO|nr:anaerobic ribonucleoside-triphosphate reductase activating protein [Isoptericola jiangsuensis]PFG43337.1 pyruvate formate lyase activating enzyme [Isoptericola jiangsuensis]